MNKLKFLAVMLGTLAIGATAVQAQNPVKERQELMKSVGQAAKAAGMMVRGKVPYDAAKAAQAMQTIAGVPDKFKALFPKGSDSENAVLEFDTESTALAKIWSETDKFNTGLEKLKREATAAVDAANAGEGAFKQAFGGLTKLCKGCHEAYRIKKE